MNNIYEIKTKPLFYSDVFYIANVGTLEQRKSLIQEILDAKREDEKGTTKSNAGCWRKTAPCKDESIKWLINDIVGLLDKVQTHYEGMDETLQQRKDLPEIDIRYWANVNAPGAENVMHSHKIKQYSAVYYLQASGTGSIKFTNPANLLADCNWGSPFTRDFELHPDDGDLLLWPAWVPHLVSRNNSDKDRINLVFDFDVKENE